MTNRFYTALFSCVFLLTFFFSSYSYSNLNNNQSIDDEVQAGLTDIYNLRFDEAENKFREIQRKYPDDAKGYFYEAEIYYYRTLPARNEAMYEKFIELTDKLLDFCDKKLDKNENDIETLYYKGQTHSYRSLLMLNLNKSLIRAASNGNDGYRILSDVIRKKPDYYDAYMGLGLYKIAIGFVPEKFQWLLNIIGFDGNIKNGLEMLKTSMDKGKFTKVESKIYYAISSITEKEDDNQLSIEYAKQISDAYPESPLFKLIYAALMQERGKMEQSLPIVKEALELNNRSLQNEMKKGGYALLGNAYFKLNDFPRAISTTEEFFKYVNFSEDRYNIARYSLGLAYEMIGQRGKAIENYTSVRDKFIEERDGEGEKLFYRLSRERMQKPFRDIDSLMLIANNNRESGKFDEALEIYSKLLAAPYIGKFTNDDDKAQLYSQIGHAYLMKRNTDKAMEYFNKVITLKPEKEVWHVPHSYFELGKIYYKRGDKNKADEYFEKIYDFSDYDFKNFLEMRLANFKAKN